jgi:hypothetical protein
MFVKEIIAVYTENYTKPINTKYTIKYCYVAGTYIYHQALERVLYFTLQSVDNT